MQSPQETYQSWSCWVRQRWFCGCCLWWPVRGLCFSFVVWSLMRFLLQKELLTIPGSWIRGGRWHVGYLHFSFLCIFLPLLYSIEITPPPTPSPTKATGRKKRAITGGESDDDDAFVPRYDIIWSVSFLYYYYFILMTLQLVLQGRALKRPVTKSLPLPQRIQSLVVGLSLMCNYLF